MSRLYDVVIHLTVKGVSKDDAVQAMTAALALANLEPNGVESVESLDGEDHEGDEDE